MRSAPWFVFRLVQPHCTYWNANLQFAPCLDTGDAPRYPELETTLELPWIHPFPPRCAARLDLAGLRRSDGAGVSLAPHQADRALPRRRRHGHHCPRSREQGGHPAGLDARGRQQAGFRRQPRRGCGRQGGARRLHARAGPDQQPGDQSHPLRQAALQPGEGPDAGRPGRQCAAGPRGRDRFALQDAGRRGRGRQGQARRPQLRQFRQRHGGAPGDRAVPEDGGRQADARAVQGRGARRDRPDRRPDPAVHVLDPDAHRPHQNGKMRAIAVTSDKRADDLPRCRPSPSPATRASRP